MTFDLILIPRVVVLLGFVLGALLGLSIGRRTQRKPSRPSCVTCGEPLFMCDDCGIKHRFRYVQTPPDVIRWSDGGPHPENDCGSVCAKYVRVPN